MGNDGVRMKKKRDDLTKLTKETPDARRKRVASGVRFRAAVFENKRKKLRDKLVDNSDKI